MHFRPTHWSDAASTWQRDSSEEQQPAGDHCGVRWRRHRCRRGHRGTHLHTAILRTTKEVSPFCFSLLSMVIWGQPWGEG